MARVKKRFKKFNGQNFYGIDMGLLAVDGLSAEIRNGKQEGKNYSYVVFRDGNSIKWKIVPAVNPAGTLRRLTLLHRNTYGRRGFHKQTFAWGNPTGLRELVDIIRKHEVYEKGKLFKETTPQCPKQNVYYCQP